MDRVTHYIVTMLAAIGLVSVAAFAGLYLAGFFHWAAKKAPGNAVLQFFFGVQL